jgi:hypothetical protein
VGWPLGWPVGVCAPTNAATKSISKRRILVEFMDFMGFVIPFNQRSKLLQTLFDFILCVLYVSCCSQASFPLQMLLNIGCSQLGGVAMLIMFATYCNHNLRSQ